MSDVCPAEHELVAFAAGAPERRAELEAHLASCERCRVAVALLHSQPAEPVRPAGLQRRGDVVGRYVVLEFVGEGAMGRVYAAYDPVLDRKVALKLLHPLADGPSAQERLLREAKALAKVSHPHLVAVHDAGSFGDSVFLAMEFVEGQTLRAWLAAAKRTEAELVDVFAQAGRGLAAAHEAGLVHRDFKPENVLVGRDGRVRVSDFGLARELSAPLPLEGPTPIRGGAASTHTGALVGTPAYMAPEQLGGERADERADQFAFCVALAEALGGGRPFPENTLAQVRAGPKLTASARLTKVLTRGLSAEPAARYPSMSALLAALRPPARRSSVLVPLVALGALAVVVGGWLLQRQTLCRSGSSRVAAVWSAERRQALAAHFGTLGGADAFARIGERLDRWAEDWSTQHREACEATRLRGEQSDQVLTVRMACLDRRLLEVEGALGVLATTSGDSLPRAQDAVLSLTPLSVCANTTALLAPVPRPEQPAMRERVEFIERELSRAQALREAGRFKEGLPLATTAALEAHALGWAPLEAEALLVRGQLLDGNGEFALAEATLRDAWTRAHAARDDRLATLIAIDVSFVLNELSRMKESDEWVWQASALAPRVGQDWELEARVATQQGHLLYTRADFTGAEVRYRRAWELRRDHQGASHPRTVAMLANVANSIGAQGRFEQAAELLVDAARQLEQALGRSHHKVGQAWNAVAEKLVALHRSAEALAAIDGILPEQEKVLGASSPFVARLHLGRAEALRELGKHEEALGEYQRSLATFEQASMPLMVGITLSAMGATSCALRRLDEGLAFTDRARALLAETFGADHEEATVALEVRGECLLEAGKPQPALEAFVTSLAARERAGDEDWTARSLVGLGRAHLALGHHADAKTLLARAVTSLEKSKLDDALLDTARGALASAR